MGNMLFRYFRISIDLNVQQLQSLLAEVVWWSIMTSKYSQMGNMRAILKKIEDGFPSVMCGFVQLFKNQQANKRSSPVFTVGPRTNKKIIKTSHLISAHVYDTIIICQEILYNFSIYLSLTRLLCVRNRGNIYLH